jgi:arylsulfatase A-like enzyme
MSRSLGVALRGIPVLLATLLLFGLAGCDDADPLAAQSAPKPSARPNLVLITLDTLRADALGSYGQTRKPSPEIDRLADEGVLFVQVVTSSAETLPSHASIFTGLHPFEHGVRTNAGDVLGRDNITLAERLRGAGYATGAEISANVLRKETHITRGFAHYRGADSEDVEFKQLQQIGGDAPTTKKIRTGADITRRGIEFITDHRERPFFLWLHYFDTHDPNYAPAEFRGRFPGEPYFDEVASVDSQIGRLRETIEELNLTSNTLVVLTSDHGEGLGEHGERSHAFFVYDTTMRVPLIFWGLSNLPQGVRIGSLVRTVDILPTVLDLLGRPRPKRIRGRSLRPLIEKPDTDLELVGYGEATSFLRAFGIQPLRFVREGNWKYIHKQNPELYDVSSDPGETRNLIGENPDVAAALLARLEELLSHPKHEAANDHREITPERAAELRALGYAFAGEGTPIGEEIESIRLRGDDPVERIADIDVMSMAGGFKNAGSHEEALAYIADLYQREPGNVFVQGIVLDSLLALNRHAEALPLLVSKLDRSPQHVAIRIAHAETLIALDRALEALETLRVGLAVTPCDDPLNARAERTFRAQNRLEEIHLLRESGLESCPDNPLLLNNHAWAMATSPHGSLRNGSRAIRLSERAIQERGSRSPDFLDTLAAAHAESGDFAKAVQVIDEAVALLVDPGADNSTIANILRAHRDAFQIGNTIQDPAATSK